MNTFCETKYFQFDFRIILKELQRIFHKIFLFSMCQNMKCLKFDLLNSNWIIFQFTIINCVVSHCNVWTKTQKFHNFLKYLDICRWYDPMVNFAMHIQTGHSVAKFLRCKCLLTSDDKHARGGVILQLGLKHRWSFSDYESF